MPHAPPTQVGDPLFVEHARAHPPQLLVSELVAVSHPLRLTFSLAEQSL